MFLPEAVPIIPCLRSFVIRQLHVLIVVLYCPFFSFSMDAEAFRKYGKEMVDFVADYWESLPARKPLPDVQPGYIWEKVPTAYALHHIVVFD